MNSSITGECRVLMIPISNIKANRYSRRGDFTADMRALKLSIEQAGILQPLTVRRVMTDRYELIAGERRLRAAVAAGLSAVPCIVIHCTEEQSAIYTVVENTQRKNLDMFEYSEELSTLCSSFENTPIQAAATVGLPCSSVISKLSLLDFSEEERALIKENNITERQALTVLKLEESCARVAVLRKTAENKLDLEQTELLVKRINSISSNERERTARTVVIKDLRPFYNTINKSVKTLRMSGIDVESTRREADDRIEIKITIRK